MCPLLVFHEQQTLNLLKAALLLKGIEEKDSSDNLAGIGKALLIITDLAEGEPGNLLNLELGAPDYFERWLGYILANYLFSTDTVSPYVLARSYDLYLTDKPSLKGCGSYVNLQSALQTTTGLEAEALWSATFALSGHWMGLSAETVPEETMAIGRSSYFSGEFSFASDEVERFFAFCVSGIDDLKANVEALYAPDSLRPFDVLPFARRPLVAFGDRIYATSIPLLRQKLTTGLHHLYLDRRLAEEQRQRYLTYMGEVFGDYVHRAFERMFPPLSGRYLRLDDSRADMKGKYCDGLVSYEDAVVLIEAKASLFPLEARVGHDGALIRGRLKDIYCDGAVQLQATIEALRQGLRDSQGIIPKQIKRYYPIIVTLENMPMNPFIYGEIRRILAPHGLLYQSDVQPLQSIDIGELERIEAVLAGGASLKQLINDKLLQPAEAEDSWGNYLYRRRDRLNASPNQYLQELAIAVSERTRQFFEERKRRAA